MTLCVIMCGHKQEKAMENIKYTSDGKKVLVVGLALIVSPWLAALVAAAAYVLRGEV